MKNINLKSGIILTALGMLLAVTACKHDHDHEGHDHGEDGHDHGAETRQESEDDHDHATTVHLNQAQFKNVEIDTGWFSMKNLSDVVYASGYTKLDPQDQAVVSLPLSGTIKSIKVIEGSYVKKGQSLASVFSLEMGNMLLEKSKIQENLDVSEANLAYLRADLERQKALANDKINARKNLEKAQADFNVESAKIEAHKNQIAILAQTIGNFSSGGSNYIPVIAPISGHITEVDVRIGESVSAGQKMFSIVDNSQMHVDLLVYEKDLANIKVGQKVRFNLTNQTNTEIKGEIYNIGKSFANDTKSVAVHADIEKNNQNLIPGMYINALIDIGEKQVRALPETAVVRAEGREFVFLWMIENEESDNKDEIDFERLEVKTGSRQLGFVEVTPLDEIAKGDKIVLNGAYYLQSHLQKMESGGGHSH